MCSEWLKKSEFFWEKVKLWKFSTESERFYGNTRGKSETEENASLPQGGWTPLSNSPCWVSLWPIFWCTTLSALGYLSLSALMTSWAYSSFPLPAEQKTESCVLSGWPMLWNGFPLALCSRVHSTSGEQALNPKQIPFVQYVLPSVLSLSYMQVSILAIHNAFWIAHFSLLI